MPRLIAILLMTCLSFGAAYAEIYKCIINGKPAFSQTPCAADAEVVKLKVQQPSQQAREHAEKSAESFEMMNAENARKNKIKSLRRQNRNLHDDIANYQDKMDAEISVLKAKKRRAANNLAGATWEDSISSEMTAITDKYQIKIDAANKKIDRNNSKIDALELATN